MSEEDNSNNEASLDADIEKLVKKIYATKYVLGKPPPKNPGELSSSQQAFKDGKIGVATRWKKGCANGNLKGPGKAKVVFWRYVCNWLDTLLKDIDIVDESELTLSQLGALKFAKAVASGKWLQTKEVIDRELGRVGEALGDDDKPRVIRFPLTIPDNETIGSHIEIGEVNESNANAQE